MWRFFSLAIDAVQRFLSAVAAISAFSFDLYPEVCVQFPPKPPFVIVVTSYLTITIMIIFRVVFKGSLRQGKQSLFYPLLVD